MAGVLVLLSIVLITVYFREPAGGSLHGIQSGGAAVLRPFEVAADRIASPFRDGYNWFAGLVHAKSENARLRSEVDKYSQLATQNANASQENAVLRRELHYVGSRQFPSGFDYVATDVISRPPGEFEQQIVIAAGTSEGVRFQDPVVTPDGLVGLVTKAAHDSAQVTLLTDPTLNVTAVDRVTGATGIVRTGQGRGTLILDRVAKSQTIHPDDLIVTQGWHFNRLSSLYPGGIPIATVAGASVNDLDLFWQVQLQPRVDFGSLDSVIVLVPKKRR